MEILEFCQAYNAANREVDEYMVAARQLHIPDPAIAPRDVEVRQVGGRVEVSIGMEHLVQADSLEEALASILQRVEESRLVWLGEFSRICRPQPYRPMAFLPCGIIRREREWGQLVIKNVSYSEAQEIWVPAA